MINFLVWWNPSTWFNDVTDGLFGALYSGIRFIFYVIAEAIYSIMISLYNVFDALCSTRLLDNNILNQLSERVGLILGIIMFFYVTISFVKILINPDQLSDAKTGAVGIIKKILIVIALLGVSSFAFNALFYVQKVIISNHIVSKIILPYDVQTDKFGNALSAELFTSFFRVRGEFYDDDGQLSTQWKQVNEVRICEATVWTLKDDIYNYGDFSIGNSCLNEVATVNNSSVSGGLLQKTIIDFSWFFMIGVGIAIDYFLISYCIAVGVRMIKLTILEIISPMAFVSYLSPKQDSMFSKWVKVYFSTYLDVFIRIAIISFAVFLCITVMNVGNNDWEFWKNINAGYNINGNSKFVIEAFMIIALLSFAKKAPDLLKELGFDLTGRFGGFHFKDALGLTAGIGVAGMGVGATVGGVANSVVGMIDRARMAHTLGRSPLGIVGAALSGAGGGLARGLHHGFQNKGQFWKNIPAGFKAQYEADLAYEQLIANGGTARGRVASRLLSHFGETPGHTYARVLENLNQIEEYKKRMYDAADEAVAVKSAKDTWEQMHQNPDEGDDAYEERKRTAYERYKNLRNSFVDAAVSGSTTYLGGTMNEDDQRFSTDVRAIISEANSFSMSRNVKRWDATTHSYTSIGPITSREKLADASNFAHETRTYITSEARPSYAASLANDAAAGVSDKRKNGPLSGGH